MKISKRSIILAIVLVACVCLLVCTLTACGDKDETNSQSSSQETDNGLCANGHTRAKAVEENVVDATCTKDGSYETVVYCKVCGKELSRQKQTIEKLGHDIIHYDAQAPDYDHIGWNAYDTCSRCDYSTYEELPKLQYNNTQAEITSATNIAFNGTTGHYTVPNATTTFSFINEIKVSKYATWQLSTDITAQNTVPSKTATLEVGDNTFYILVTSGDGNNIGFYTVIIRRRPIYTVTFNSNGGTSCYAQYVEEDKCASAPTTTRTGYSFADWKWQDNEFDFSTPITTNMTLYAVWDLVDYNITYNLDGGTNDLSNPSTYTTENTITLATPTKTGYTFDGWYSDSGLTNKVTSIPQGSYGDKTLYAKWTPIVYTISYNLDGGSVSGNPTSYTIESDDITLINPTKIGYIFIGWSGTDIEDKSTEVTISKGSYGDRSYVANWGMSNFEFTSTATTCTITGIKDKTVKSIVVPDYVTNINKGAFSGCGLLESITLPFVGSSYDKTSSDKYQYPFGYIFGENSYTGGIATTQQYYGSSTNDITSSTYYIPSSLKSVTITGGNILPYAFYNCSSLTSVTIPDSVTSIGSAAFYECSGLTAVHITDLAAWCNIEFEYYAANPLYYAPNLYLNGKLVTDLVIPDTVTEIKSYAFFDCRKLTSVTIGNSVTSIGYAAFFECSGLTSITISDSVTSIGASAFYKCSGLKSIIIPDSVTSIGSGAFSGCSGLTSITVASGNSKYHSAGNCIIETASKTLLLGCKNSVIPDDGSVTSIGYEAFRGCSGLTSITIPNSVTSIGYDAFYGCSGLTSITIPNSVTSIGSGAFEYCSKLTSITFADTTMWYRTTSTTNWQNKTGGTSTIVTNASTNATNFTSTYRSSYWYKL